MKTELKCILFNPCFSYVKGSIYKEVSNLDPPLGLASLSSFLNVNGFPTMVFDLNTEIKSNQELPEFLSAISKDYYFENPIIGISFITTFANNSYELAEISRKQFPNSLIIAGGAHATFMATEVLEAKNIDIVVRGEGELSLLDIASGKSLKEIEGISYKVTQDNKDIIIHNTDRARIRDLDSLPMPAYNQLKLEKYQPVLGSYKSLPAANLVTSRGCPGKCKFCCRTMGNFVSFKSAKNIINEIEYLIENNGIRQINFYDDTFTVKKSRVIEFCDLVLSRKLKFDWTCFARVDFIDKELLNKMKEAGCYQIMYGVENFDQNILDEISKKIDIERVNTVVKLTKKTGINCRISLLIGNPGDTIQSYRINIKAVKRLNPDILVVNISTPLPGTEM